MDTFKLLTTALFIFSLILSFVTAIHLYRKHYAGTVSRYMNPRRRRFLIVGGLSIIAITLFGIKIYQEAPPVYQETDELLVSCNGWIIQQRELKPDACEPEHIR